MYKNRSQGFTLIELLIVIAIIGILSAVVLASLNTARSKGQDAAIQSNMSAIATQAEIWYGSNNNVYETTAVTGTCPSTANATSFFGDATVIKALNATITANASSGISCYANAISYVVAAKLVANTGYWCTDSSGTSKTEAGAIPTFTAAGTPAAYTCP